MDGLILTIKEFVDTETDLLLSKLHTTYPQVHKSQMEAWHTLIEDIKGAKNIDQLPFGCVVAIEYSLPTEGMAVDLIFAGKNSSGKKEALLVEAKQWNDQLIYSYSFSAYREDEKELHPQVQVSKHRLSFSQYLDKGNLFIVKPAVYIRNCSTRAAEYLSDVCPKSSCKVIPILNSIEKVIDYVAENIKSADYSIVHDLRIAQYSPSIEILDAMRSIVTKEEPFILTAEQARAVQKIKESIASGKRIVRIVGAAGTGKTAILLNLYVEYLDNAGSSDIRPIFISGAQNTALYRSLYPSVEGSFNYSFSLKKMVAKTKGNLYVILMDEAQHNAPGIITEMVNRGCTLIVCYDENQTINADNSLEELDAISKRDDFIAIELKERVRFNGSQLAEAKIKKYLNGDLDMSPDDKFEFQAFDDFLSFQKKVIETINKNPNDTVAVAGLLSKDSDEFTFEKNPDSVLFTKWTNKSECEWIPYVKGKDYLKKNDGKIWVGTWWMPGLDVDYIAVIVGGDAILTDTGVLAVPEQAKHYRMMVSVAQKIGLPNELILEKKVFGKISTDYYRSSKAIIEYVNQRGHEEQKDQFLRLFSTLLKNNYYITLSRGRKGCFVYFSNHV